MTESEGHRANDNRLCYSSCSQIQEKVAHFKWPLYSASKDGTIWFKAVDGVTSKIKTFKRNGINTFMLRPDGGSTRSIPYQSRLMVFECFNKRRLNRESEIICHKNGNDSDDRLDNLSLVNILKKNEPGRPIHYRETNAPPPLLYKVFSGTRHGANNRHRAK